MNLSSMEILHKCINCGVEKSHEDFYVTNRRRGVSSRCKQCIGAVNRKRLEARRLALRRWRQNNPQRAKDLHCKYADKKKPLMRAIILEAKDRPCMDCGVQYPPEAMDFDHRPGTEKKFKIGTAASRGQAGRSIDSLKAEIAKCDVVCGCCHRLRTHGRWVHTGTSSTIYRYRYLQSVINLAKDRPCACCGKTFLPCQMDFDHLGNKADSVSELARKRASFERLETEIAKCQVLCVNCHRTKTLRGAF